MDEYGIFQSIVETDAMPTKPANGAQTDNSKPAGTKPAGSSSSPAPSTSGSSAGAKPAGGSKPTDVNESSIHLI